MNCTECENLDQTTEIIMLSISILTTTLTFILNIYQSVQSRHFHSECMGCKIDYDSEHQDVTK